MNLTKDSMNWKKMMMKKKSRTSGWFEPHVLSPISAYAVIIMSVWGHYDTGAKGVMLPVLMAVLILIMNNGVQYKAKGPTWAVIILTITVIAVVTRGITTHHLRHDMDSLIRAVVMTTTSGIALLSLLYSISKRNLVKV